MIVIVHEKNVVVSRNIPSRCINRKEKKFN